MCVRPIPSVTAASRGVSSSFSMACLFSGRAARSGAGPLSLTTLSCPVLFDCRARDCPSSIYLPCVFEPPAVEKIEHVLRRASQVARRVSNRHGLLVHLPPPACVVGVVKLEYYEWEGV